MPALQPDYDYYEYARRRQGAVKNAVPSSAVHKKSSATKSVTASKVSPKNLKTTTTRDVTKNATRIATRDDSFINAKKRNTTTTNKTSSKSKKGSKQSLDPVVFNNKKTLQKPQEMTLKKPKNNVKAKNIQKQKARVKEMLKNFVVVSMMFGMFFLICYRYSMINESFNELNNLKSDVKDKQTINAQLESNIKQNTDLSYIENYAKYQLGMQKPKESQVQRITIGKQDKIILPVDITEEEEESFLETLINDIKKIID